MIMAQIIWSTRRLVKVLLGIQQKFYQTSSRAIFLLLDVQQIFTPSKRRLVGSYFSATRRLVENFYQTSSTKSSTRRLVEQKIWAIILVGWIHTRINEPAKYLQNVQIHGNTRVKLAYLCMYYPSIYLYIYLGLSCFQKNIPLLC